MMAEGGGMPKLEISKVHDAYAAPGECPLCILLHGAENAYLASFQHSRVMEPNVRIKTNASGFCPDHYRKLYARENKQGLSLVTHTHLAEQLPRLSGLIEASLQPGRKGREKIEQAVAGLTALINACFLCDLLRSDGERYAFTILYLWTKDPEFPPVFRASSGFCLPHFRDMCAAAQRMLRPDRREGWMREAAALMTASLERLEKEILAFTQLYRDTNPGLGSDEVRTALARTLQKLAGGLFSLEDSGEGGAPAPRRGQR
jgi:hypothetical protein